MALSRPFAVRADSRHDLFAWNEFAVGRSRFGQPVRSEHQRRWPGLKVDEALMKELLRFLEHADNGRGRRQRDRLVDFSHEDHGIVARRGVGHHLTIGIDDAQEDAHERLAVARVKRGGFQVENVEVAQNLRGRQTRRNVCAQSVLHQRGASRCLNALSGDVGDRNRHRSVIELVDVDEVAADS